MSERQRKLKQTLSRSKKTVGDKTKIKEKQSTPPITCFTTKTGPKADSVKSPEYTMSRNTRNSNKGEDDAQDEVRSHPTDDESESETTHSGVLPCPDRIDIDQFTALSHTDQMEKLVKSFNHLLAKVTEIDVVINHDSDGLQTKLQVNQEQTDQQSINISKVTSDITTMKKEIQSASANLEALQVEQATNKCIMQRQSNQLKTINSKVAMLTKKSMEKNITISNLEGDCGKDEKVKENVLEFLRTTLEIDAEEHEIFVAHRTGKHKDDQKRPRLIVARLKYELKERIFENIKNLKGKTNSKNAKYYINKQLPDSIIEQKRKIKQQIQAQKAKDKHLPIQQRSDIEVKHSVVLIDGTPAKDPMPPIEIDDMYPDKAEKEKQNKVKLIAADPRSEGNSDFFAYAARTHQLHEVRRAYKKVRLLHPRADHVIAAYSVRNYRGYQDDGEHGAGVKLINTLDPPVRKDDDPNENEDETDDEGFTKVNRKRNDPLNISVFVVRNFGGLHMGAERFKIIKNIAIEAVNRML